MGLPAFGTNYHTVQCCRCGTTIALDKTLYEALHQNHETFWCPNGHQQHFMGKSYKEQLDEANKKLNQERKLREWAENAADKERERLKRLKAQKQRMMKRIKNGVCPCCKRSFANLHRHMATKHPEFKP